MKEAFQLVLEGQWSVVQSLKKNTERLECGESDIQTIDDDLNPTKFNLLIMKLWYCMGCTGRHSKGKQHIKEKC